MSFRILVFYKTDEALDRYLSQFKIGACDLDAYLLKKTKDDRLYAGFHIEILCKRGLNESHRGYRAHFVAVQEELTWGDNWDFLEQHVIRPTMLTPIPTHIFDGISQEEINEHYKEDHPES